MEEFAQHPLHDSIDQMNPEQVRDILHRLVTTALDARVCLTHGFGFDGFPINDSARASYATLSAIIINYIKRP